MWLVAAAAWGLAEATLFFIVPDVLLSWLAAFRPRFAWPAVVACLAGALAGGALMYLAAADAPGRMRALLEAVPAVSDALVSETGAGLEADYGRRMLSAGFSGVPYKILAVESGARAQGLATFLGWSVLARLPRWVLVVLVARGVTSAVRDGAANPDRFLWGLWAALWSIVYVVYFSVMGW
jgi:membrane protein YqaA with SNARE-associated domain